MRAPTKPVPALLTLALVWLFPFAARAQLVRVSPGPLSDSHKKWDGAGDCFECHTKNGEELSCFGCHQHRALEKAIAEGHGLHANLDRPCASCHQEHKGRAREPATWSSLGGRAGFRHDRTGFPLTGGHKDKAKCNSCHQAKTPMGRRSFVGLSAECATCHEDPHDFSNSKLKTRCTLCHVAGKAPRDLRGGDVKFDHAADGGGALVGRHAKARCVDCHQGHTLKIDRARRSCKGCHQSPHRGRYAKWDCAECHSPSRSYAEVRFSHQKTGASIGGRHRRVACDKCHGNATDKPATRCDSCHESGHKGRFEGRACASCHPDGSWKATRFDHTKSTKVRLAGRHKRVDCAKCHKSGTRKPKRNCDSCHKDRHKGRFADRACTQCHPDGSWKPSRFRHGERTEFPLTGRHQKTGCRSCHRGKKPTRFERVAASCSDCHTHKKAHGGQFAGDECIRCHPTNSATGLAFDHDKQARFPLTGLHARLNKPSKCKSCHQRGNYRTNQIRCADCHDDAHRAELGIECERCHTTDVAFADIEFDHDRQAGFPIQGLHQKLDCSACHPADGEPHYRIGKSRCVDCHRADDPHRGGLGDKCEQCHRVEKGAPKFSHEATGFSLSGGHERVACAFCHRPQPKSGPPRVGWTRDQRPRKLSLAFPVMGRACQECHADDHDGRFGAQCASCHRTTAFSDVSTTIHDTGASALRGTHDRLPCASCHQPQRLLRGLGETCQSCHWDDDRHGNALGPFCGDCHQQRDWRPTRFSHAQTGFVLRGRHRTAPCEGCHGVGTYQGTPTDCESCHDRDAAATVDPIHSAEFGPCASCHRETSFAAVRIQHTTFPLSGQHRFVRCRNCHPTGAYAGTPTSCESCHLTRYYDPRIEPDHAASGYATSCEDCHRPTGWRPATR